jgi:hypothetical protein
MFRKIHESLSQKSLGMHLRWDRVVVPVGAFFITAAALLMTAGTLAAELTRSAGRDDSSLYQGDPGLSPPPRPLDINDFPGNPSEDDSPPRPLHFRVHDPDAAPRHRPSPH